MASFQVRTSLLQLPLRPIAEVPRRRYIIEVFWVLDFDMKKLLSFLKPLTRILLVIGLVLTLSLGQADSALAARSGGRIGGGSFRAPSRGYSSPSRTYRAPSGGYYPGGGGAYYPGGGGGFGFPFLLPVFGFGGAGGILGIFVAITVASFLLQTFRRINGGDDSGLEPDSNPTVSIAQVQVGLLSSARSLQSDLNRIGASANTNSTEGLTQVLQETTLALLRHPEYWVYAGTEAQQTRLGTAEAQFNRLALSERSKFTEETLSNVNSQLQLKAVNNESSELTLNEGNPTLVAQPVSAPGEYLVATLIVAAQGKLQLPTINNTEDLRRVLSQIGAISSDRLLAVEILWSPQDATDTLTADDLLSNYANLKLI